MGLKFANFVCCLPDAIRHKKKQNFLSEKTLTKSWAKKPRE